MPAEGTLNGRCVLVLEDDYYLAQDLRDELEGAGAAVLGPFSSLSDAEARPGGAEPDCAVTDINLGAGPSFEAARALLQRGVPVIFVTGYDVGVIPDDLRRVTCVQKPARPGAVTAAVRAACGR